MLAFCREAGPGPRAQAFPAAPPAPPAAGDLTVLSLSGEALLRRPALPEQGVQQLRAELAALAGYPGEAVRLLEGVEEVRNGQELRPGAVLSCVLLAPPAEPGSRLFWEAVRKGQHGYARCMLQMATAAEQRELMLGSRNGLPSRDLAPTAELLVQAAAELGILGEWLQHMGMDDSLALLLCAAGRSPEQLKLLLAALEGLGKRAELLLARGLQGTALHEAAAAGQVAAAEMLLDAARAEGLLAEMLAARDFSEATALQAAARHRRATALRALLAAAEGVGLLQEVEEAAGTGAATQARNGEA